MGRFFRCAAMMDPDSLAGMDSVLSGRDWLNTAGVLRIKVGRTTTCQHQSVIRDWITIEQMSLRKT